MPCACAQSRDGPDLRRGAEGTQLSVVGFVYVVPDAFSWRSMAESFSSGASASQSPA